MQGFHNSSIDIQKKTIDSNNYVLTVGHVKKQMEADDIAAVQRLKKTWQDEVGEIVVAKDCA